MLVGPPRAHSRFEFDGNDPILQKWHSEDRIIRLGLSAGDLLLWDSRTVHCSYPPEAAGEDAAEGHIVRAAALVTMCPRGDVSVEVREERRRQVSVGEA